MWIRELGLAEGTVCLNVGSSTGEFRRTTQPHIHRELIAPIERAGLRVIHCDIKEAEGVDEVGDLLSPEYRERLCAYNAHVMICSNLLEHLTNPQEFAARCGELVRPGGYGIFTVPYSYPYHPDPIDTMLRPSPAGLAGMLKDWVVVRQEIIRGGNHWGDLRRSGEPLSRLFKQVARTLMPFYRRAHWKHVAHRLLWLKRPFTSSAVLLRKPD
jgi:SAM-dependent methyltransferase